MNKSRSNVAQADCTAANTIPVLNANVVDDAILLEYMQQIDHGENRDGKDPLTCTHTLEHSLTYMNSFESRNPTGSTHMSMAPYCDYKFATDYSNVLFMSKTSISLLINMLVALSQRKDGIHSSQSRKKPLNTELIRMKSNPKPL
jgi:hypothetical protein